VNSIWVDQRTLTLSMSPGGCIHLHLMDGFGVLHNVAQYERHREGLANKNDILMHVVIKDITVSTNHNYLYCLQIPIVYSCV
jgi:hypothetical protein